MGSERANASRAVLSSLSASPVRRSSSASFARHRTCALWCAFSTASSCCTSFATLRFSAADRSASVPCPGGAAAAGGASARDAATIFARAAILSVRFVRF